MWKTNLKVLAVALVVIGFYTTVAHVIPQLQSEVPTALDLSAGVTPEALVAAETPTIRSQKKVSVLLATKAPLLMPP